MSKKPRQRLKSKASKIAIKITLVVMLTALAAFFAYTFLHGRFTGTYFPGISGYIVLPMRHWVVFSVAVLLGAVALYLLMFPPKPVKRILDAAAWLCIERILTLVRHLRFVVFIRKLLCKWRVKMSTDTIIAFLLALFTYIIASEFARIYVDTHHDGIILKPAIDVLNGHMLYRDTFTHYGALPVYLQAAAMAIFGAELLVIRLQTAFMYAITVFFIYKCWRYFLPRGYAIVSALILIGIAPFLERLLPWSSVYTMAMTAIVIFLLFKYIENNKSSLIFWAGFISSLAFYTRFPVGLVLLIGIVFLLINYGIFTDAKIRGILKMLGYFLFGYGIVILFFTVFFIATGSLYDWYVQSLRTKTVWALDITVVRRGGTLFERIFLILLFNSQQLIWRIMPVMGIVYFFNFYIGRIHFVDKQLKIERNVSQKQMMLLFFVVISLASWHQYYPVASISHVYWGTGIMIGFFVYCVWYAFDEMKISKKAVSILMILVLGLFFGDLLRARMSQGFRNRIDNIATIDFGNHLNGMRVENDQYEFLYEYFTFKDHLQHIFPDGDFVNYNADHMFTTTVKNNLFNRAVRSINAHQPYRREAVADLIELYRPIIIVDEYRGIPNIPGYFPLTRVSHPLTRNNIIMFYSHISHIRVAAEYDSPLLLNMEIILNEYDAVGEHRTEPYGDGKYDTVVRFSLSEETIINRIFISAHDESGERIAFRDSWLDFQGLAWAGLHDLGRVFLHDNERFINDEEVLDLNFNVIPYESYSFFTNGFPPGTSFLSVNLSTSHGLLFNVLFLSE